MKTYMKLLFSYVGQKAVQPWLVAQLVRTLSQYAKIMSSIPGQDTYKNQPMNA